MDNNAVTVAGTVLASMLIYIYNYLRNKRLNGANLPGEGHPPEKQVIKKKPTVDSLSARLELVEKEEVETRLERDEARRERDNAREEIGKLRGEFDAKYNSLEKLFNELRAANETITGEKETALKELKLSREEIDRLLRENNKHQETIISMGQTIKDFEADMRALRVEVDALKNLNAMLQEIKTAVTEGIRAVFSTDEFRKIVLNMKEAAP